MKKFIMLVFILAMGVFIIVGCGNEPTKNEGAYTDEAVTDIIPADDTDMEEVGGDICPCVMVNGIVYFDYSDKSTMPIFLRSA